MKKYDIKSERVKILMGYNKEQELKTCFFYCLISGLYTHYLKIAILSNEKNNK